MLQIKKNIWSKDRQNWVSPDPHNNEIAAAEFRSTANRRIAAVTAYRSQTNPCP